MKMKLPTLVLYHGDYDGFTAAWVIRSFVKNHPEGGLDKIQFKPVEYSQRVPDVAGENLCIVDFSYKRREMEAIRVAANSTLLLDHHKTAKRDLAGTWPDDCKFFIDVNWSAACLTYRYFFGEAQELPWLVAYTQDRDLWKWELPHSRAVNAFLRSHAFDFDTWDELAKIEMVKDGEVKPEIVSEGTAILRMDQKRIDEHCRFANKAFLLGYECGIVNSTVLHSEIGGQLAEEYGIGITWFQRKDGKYIYSLRSRSDEVDVSEIAKSMGGGGHAKAAGFESPNMIHCKRSVIT